MKVIIVGGVAGGATAAARIRRLDEHAEITVFERSGYIFYANCGLPYYIGDVITDPEELTLQTPESFFKRFHINMKIHHEVITIQMCIRDRSFTTILPLMPSSRPASFANAVSGVTPIASTTISA